MRMTMNEFNNWMSNLDNLIEDKMEPILEETTAQVEMTGKRIVHVQTGALRNSIEQIDQAKNHKIVRVGNSHNGVNYAKIEDNRHPFVEDMVEDGVNKLIENLIEELDLL